MLSQVPRSNIQRSLMLGPALLDIIQYFSTNKYKLQRHRLTICSRCECHLFSISILIFSFLSFSVSKFQCLKFRKLAKYAVEFYQGKFLRTALIWLILWKMNTFGHVCRVIFWLCQINFVLVFRQWFHVIVTYACKLLYNRLIRWLTREKELSNMSSKVENLKHHASSRSIYLQYYVIYCENYFFRLIQNWSLTVRSWRSKRQYRYTKSGILTFKLNMNFFTCFPMSRLLASLPIAANLTF